MPGGSPTLLHTFGVDSSHGWCKAKLKIACTLICLIGSSGNHSIPVLVS